MRSMFHLFKQKPEWIIDCFNELHSICKKRKLLIMMFLPMLALFILIIISNFQLNYRINSSQNDNKLNTIIKKINDVGFALSQVENRPNILEYNQKKLEKDMTSVKQSLENISKESDISKIADQIHLIQSNIDKQIDDIKKSLSSNLNTKQYLNQSNLPFEMLTIDVISGQSYVSVNYNNHVFPLAINDVLAGWRVKVADFDENTAEFVNSKGQYIKIILPEISQ